MFLIGDELELAHLCFENPTSTFESRRVVRKGGPRPLSRTLEDKIALARDKPCTLFN
jgi:hypothetical protein